MTPTIQCDHLFDDPPLGMIVFDAPEQCVSTRLGKARKNWGFSNLLTFFLQELHEINRNIKDEVQRFMYNSSLPWEVHNAGNTNETSVMQKDILNFIILWKPSKVISPISTTQLFSSLPEIGRHWGQEDMKRQTRPGRNGRCGHLRGHIGLILGPSGPNSPREGCVQWAS